MRRGNHARGKGTKRSDKFWSNVYAHQDNLRELADVLPTKVLLRKLSGVVTDVTSQYIQTFK